MCALSHYSQPSTASVTNKALSLSLKVTLRNLLNSRLNRNHIVMYDNMVKYVYIHIACTLNTTGYLNSNWSTKYKLSSLSHVTFNVCLLAVRSYIANLQRNLLDQKWHIYQYKYIYLNNKVCDTI